MDTVVTTGKKYTDIDGLACVIAYTNLLNQRNLPALAVLPGDMNQSVTSEFRALNFEYMREPAGGNNRFVIMDVSDPDQFPGFVEASRVEEIYDHHFGFEDFWQQKLGKRSHIESVGACATLIWELFDKSEKADVKKSDAKLLLAAVVSNTLFFNAPLTTERDRKAFGELKAFLNLDDGWVDNYYEEQECHVFRDMAMSIDQDTKEVSVPMFNGTLVIGQLELWNGKRVLDSYMDIVSRELSKNGCKYWFLNLQSIGEHKNYIYTKNSEVKDVLEKIMSVKFVGDVAETNRLWMRKEILKHLYSTVK